MRVGGTSVTVSALLPGGVSGSRTSCGSIARLGRTLSVTRGRRVGGVTLANPFNSKGDSILVALVRSFAGRRGFLPVSLTALRTGRRRVTSSRGRSASTRLASTRGRGHVRGLGHGVRCDVLRRVVCERRAQAMPGSHFEGVMRLSGHRLVECPLYYMLALIYFLVLFRPGFTEISSVCSFFD